MSPTERSLAECRKRGWVAQVVERWNPHAHIRQDLFGVIDIVALTDTGIMAIQACSGTDHAKRLAKVLAEPRTKRWLGSGGAFEVWSWSLKGARGKRKTWQLRAESVSRGMFHDEAVP
jgi:hypothetical protein